MPNSQERTLSPLERELLTVCNRLVRSIEECHSGRTPHQRVAVEDAKKVVARAEALAKPDLDGAETP